MPAHNPNPVMEDGAGNYVKYDIPTAWGSSPVHDLKLPSGSIIQVKRVDMVAIVAADMVDEFDKLSTIAEDKVVKPAQGRRPTDRQPKQPTKAEKAAAEAKAQSDFFKSGNLETLLVLMGRLIPQVVLQPKVADCYTKEDGKWTLVPYDERIAGMVYPDSIPLADQMAILSFTMEGMDSDMAGLANFRQQSEQAVGNMEPEPDTSGTAVGTDGGEA
jgi:hypothetical protein